LARWGDDFAARVDATSAALMTSTMRELNEQVASGEDIATVAARWLASEGLT
jgi:glycine betaine/choline ABC-type transport system substrate-binding protein